MNMALFGNNQGSPPPKSDGQLGAKFAPTVNIIAPGAIVEGTIRTESDLRVSGHVKGTLHVDGCCNVSSEGCIEGSMFAVKAQIAGSVKGELEATERVLLASSAFMEGTIRSARLIIEEGAVFNGESHMGNDLSSTPAHNSTTSEQVASAEIPQQLNVLDDD